MSWQFWVVAIYSVVNLVIGVSYWESGKRVKVTATAVLIQAIWYVFVLWTVSA